MKNCYSCRYHKPERDVFSDSMYCDIYQAYNMKYAEYCPYWNYEPEQEPAKATNCRNAYIFDESCAACAESGSAADKKCYERDILQDIRRIK